MSNSIFILPHQDDEVFAIPAILAELQSGRGQVHCVFLTNGEFYRPIGRIRNRESLDVLLGLGVREENIHFIGSQLGIPDGYLHEHVEKIYEALKEIVTKIQARTLYTTAWEGGHQDHDTSAIVSQKLMVEFGISEGWQFYLYNGETTVWKFFRVLKPVLLDRKDLKILPLRIVDRLKMIFSVFRYRSQAKAWLGLFPDFLWNVLTSRNFIMTHLALRTPLRRRPLYLRRGLSRVENLEAIVG